MKPRFYIITVLCIAIFASKVNAQWANKTLSNLTAPTAVNESLLPGKTNVKNLGSSSNQWQYLYLYGRIYLNGILAMHAHGADNFFAGPYAGNTSLTGTRNTGIGVYALYKITSGFSNTAIGFKSGYRTTTGSNNVFIGDSAGSSNTTGIYNTLIGGHAGTFTTGSYNTMVGEGAGSFTTGKANSFLGVAAGFGNRTGFNNVYVGDSSGYYGDAGKQNTIVGYQAGLHNKTDYNCFFGQQAGVNNTDGSKNTYVGYHAGNTGTTGGSNTVIGYGADISNGTFTNATAIGNLAIATSSNRVRVGNNSVTSIGGNVGWTTSSDARIKNNIKENVPGLAFINLLKPVTYHLDLQKEETLTGIKNTEDFIGKYDIQQTQFTGFIAQDVEAASKKINYDFSGVDVPKNDKDIYGLRYADFVVPLVKAVQELSKMNDDKDAKIDDLQNQINELKAMIVSNQSTANSQQSTAISSSSLSQNTPNPFSNSTTINYSLPAKFISAKIIITDKNGNALKQINLSNNKGSINVDASTLSSGAYQYSLLVDGRFIASKQMIMTK
jgi:trimeric autotransporter adhesin